ncbi:hypothetical protein ACHAXT_000304 [Thalassiosira profunda]
MLRNGMTKRGAAPSADVPHHHAAIHSLLQKKKRGRGTSLPPLPRLLGRRRGNREEGERGDGRDGRGSLSPSRTHSSVAKGVPKSIDGSASHASHGSAHTHKTGSLALASMRSSGMTASTNLTASASVTGDSDLTSSLVPTASWASRPNDSPPHQSAGSGSGSGGPPSGGGYRRKGSGGSGESGRSSSTPPSSKLNVSDRTAATGVMSQSDRTGRMFSQEESDTDRHVEVTKLDLSGSNRSHGNGAALEVVLDDSDSTGEIDGSHRTGELDGSGSSNRTGERDGSHRSGSTDRAGNTHRTGLNDGGVSAPSRAEMIAAALSEDRNKRSLSRSLSRDRSRGGSVPRTVSSGPRDDGRRGQSHQPQSNRYDQDLSGYRIQSPSASAGPSSPARPQDLRTSMNQARENSAQMSLSSQSSDDSCDSQSLSDSDSASSGSSGSVEIDFVTKGCGSVEVDFVPRGSGGRPKTPEQARQQPPRGILTNKDEGSPESVVARQISEDTHPTVPSSRASMEASQASLLSHDASGSPERKRGKKKGKLWRSLSKASPWHKKKNGEGDGVDDGGELPPSVAKAPSTAPPAPQHHVPHTSDAPWDSALTDEHAFRDSHQTDDGIQEEEDVLPWEPTVSLLLQTGQLDAIESCSEEDDEEELEGSSHRQMEYDEGDHAEADVANPSNDDRSGLSSGDGFFDKVAQGYLHRSREVRPGDVREMHISGDAASVDESTLTDVPHTTSATRRVPARGDSPKKEKRSRSLGIRRIGERFARRGRSRSRRRTEATATARGLAAVPEDAPANQRSQSAVPASSPQRAAASTNERNDVDAVKAQREASRSRSRSRSLLRRGRQRVRFLLRRGSSKSKEKPQRQVHSPRGASVNRIYDQKGSAGQRNQRDAHSLPPLARRDSPDDYSGSLDYRSRESLGSADLSRSSGGQRRARRREKCIVCRARIPRGEGIQYNDFFFCCGDGGTCFQCGTCRKQLGAEPEGCDAQIISNARGSVVQCYRCADRPLRSASVPANLRSSATTSASGMDLTGMSESTGLRQSLNLFESDSDFFPAGPPSPVAGAPGETAAPNLLRAAKVLCDKARVRLRLAPEEGEDGEGEWLSTLHFTKSDDGAFPVDSAVRVGYELDSDAYGNPNYDGYACSMIDLEDGPPRTPSVALPKLDSDEIDGTITQRLQVDLRWVDDDDDDEDDDGESEASSLCPRRAGPAMLSIEPFRTATISKETVMKVLRQTWEYQEDGVLYRLAFVVPFKKLYISWEIDEGDELDLTQCQLMAAVRLAVPRVEPPFHTAGQGEAAAAGASAHVTDHSRSGSANEGAIPNAVYAKKVSVDSTLTHGKPPALLASRKGGALDPDRDENDAFSELLSVAGCVDSTVALPTTTYIKVQKKDFDCEVGLSLIEKNGATVVAEVSQSGLFANTGIKEGCEMLAINGQCVRGPRSVLRIMKDTVGKVFVMVTDSPSPPGCRFVVKAHQSTGFGNTGKGDIKLETINGLVRVKDVAEDGMFRGTRLSRGDICLSVDGVPAVSERTAVRALGRSQSIVTVLVFSLSDFWKSVVEFIIDEKYNRWWKTDSTCTLLWGSEDCTPITLNFDYASGRVAADGNEENEIDLRYLNIILDRVMKLLASSMEAYRAKPKERPRSSSRSLSVSPSGKMNNRSDVYRRALIKLDEMRESGALSAKDYEAGKLALAQVAIQTAPS